MTVEFLLAKLKTLATNIDGVAWDGVEADLRALVLTESKRAASECKALAAELKVCPVLDAQGALSACESRILRTSPGSKGDG